MEVEVRNDAFEGPGAVEHRRAEPGAMRAHAHDAQVAGVPIPFEEGPGRCAGRLHGFDRSVCSQAKLWTLMAGASNPSRCARPEPGLCPASAAPSRSPKTAPAALRLFDALRFRQGAGMRHRSRGPFGPSFGSGRVEGCAGRDGSILIVTGAD